MRRRWILGWVLSIVLAWLAFRFRSWAYATPLVLTESGLPDLSQFEEGPCTVARVFDEGCQGWAKEKIGDLLVWGSLLGVLTMTIALARLRPDRGLSALDGDDRHRLDHGERGPANYVSAAPEVDRDPLAAPSNAGVVPDGDTFTRPASHLARSFGIAIVVAAIAVSLFFLLLGLMLSGMWND